MFWLYNAIYYNKANGEIRVGTRTENGPRLQCGCPPIADKSDDKKRNRAFARFLFVVLRRRFYCLKRYTLMPGPRVMVIVLRPPTTVGVPPTALQEGGPSVAVSSSTK